MDEDLTDYMKVAIEAFLASKGAKPEDLDRCDMDDIIQDILPVVNAVLHAYREAHRPAPMTKFLEDIG